MIIICSNSWNKSPGTNVIFYAYGWGLFNSGHLFEGGANNNVSILKVEIRLELVTLQLEHVAANRKR